MAYQDRLNTTETHINHVKGAATPVNVTDPTRKTSLVDMTILIRSIQRAEGNPDCFRRPRGDCHETACWWRPYCLEGRPL
jgi:hypothetical protein